MSLTDSIYIATLLHDIGKFIERAKSNEWKEKASKYLLTKETSSNYAHRRYSASFINSFLDKKDFLNSSIEDLVLHHHNDVKNEVKNYLSINDRGVIQKIIRIADDLASSERRENKELEPVEYYKAKIHTPFQDIIIKDKDFIKKIDNNYYIETAELSLLKTGAFPSTENISKEEVYKKLVKEFIDEFENIEDEDSLLFLLEKYLANVPAQTPTEFKGEQHLYKPDINLYDHSRSVAAIALCLYLEYMNGSWKGKDKIILSDKYSESDLDAPIILINGNLSGIQDFIFDVESKKAAQKLKGKSFFIQLLTDVISKYLLENLELKSANLLYNGGGNFFILAPAYLEQKISQHFSVIYRILKELNIYLAFGISKVSIKDFSDFSSVFSRVTESSKKNKLEKFRDLKHEELFEPFNQKLKEDDKYVELTEELVRSTNYYIKSYQQNSKVSPYQKPFVDLNKSIDFYIEKEGISSEAIVFNKTDFSKFYKGFRFAVKDLPLWNKVNKKIFIENNKLHNDKYDITSDEYKIHTGSIISFERLAQMAYFETGTQKLGVLKMDVDNLGKIFSDGLPDKVEFINEKGDKEYYSLRTISRIASISRSIKWFFEGYMNTLLSLPEYKDKLYVVFSGGDDFFVVGAWNSVFEFSLKVRQEFDEFVCHHPGITLSAALLVVDEKYPVSRFAQIAEDRLHDAKYNSPEKNSINVFDTVISWKDFVEAKNLKNKLVDLIKNYSVNRAILEKIRKSSRGFEKIHNDALKGNVKLMKVWRLTYYLRDIINTKKKDEKSDQIKEIVSSIVNQYEKLVFEALRGNSVSVKIFPIAARWAELETRI